LIGSGEKCNELKVDISLPSWGRRFAAELRAAIALRAKPACEPGFVLQIK